MKNVIVQRIRQGLLGVTLAAGLTAATASAVAAAPISSHVTSGPTSTAVAPQRLVESRGSVVTPMGYEWSVLRDDFYSYSSCENYRTTYVVHYNYVLASYCTSTKQSNGRYWLYIGTGYSGGGGGGGGGGSW